MKIKLTLPEAAAGFFRRARYATLFARKRQVYPEELEPSPCAMYLLAYGSDETRPHGLAEGAFYDKIYRSFEDTPYPAALGLSEIGPFHRFVVTRTLFVEAEARKLPVPYDLTLVMAGSLIAYRAGARFSTASTKADNEDLMRLYAHAGGELLGSYRDRGASGCETALFVFDLEKLAHPAAMRPLEGKIDCDPRILRAIRSRSLRDDERKCA